MRKYQRACFSMIFLMLFGIASPARSDQNQVSPDSRTKALYTVMEYKFNEEYASIVIRYPRFGNPVLDKLLEDTAMSPLDEFQSNVEELKTDDLMDPSRKPRYVLSIDFDIRMLTDDLLSVMYSAYVNYGGAHPSTTCVSVAADMKTGRQITLDDIFQKDSNYLSIISKQTITWFQGGIEGMDDEWLASGAGPNPDNYKVFYFQPGQIVFYFNPYQIASYAQGPQEMPFMIFEEPMASLVHPEIRAKLMVDY